MKIIKCKIILIGDVNVGKSSIIKRYVDNTFESAKESTIGAEFVLKIEENNQKDKINVNIWDTAGMERFRSISRTYYKYANGIVITYDVNSRNSFENVKRWLNDVLEYAENNQSYVFLLLGNKCEIENRKVTYEEGEKLARENDMIFYEVSAKKGININEAFTELLNKIQENKYYHVVENTNIEEIKENTRCFC